MMSDKSYLSPRTKTVKYILLLNKFWAYLLFDVESLIKGSILDFQFLTRQRKFYVEV